MSICQRVFRGVPFASLAAVVVAGCTVAENEYQPPPPPPVTVANPVLRTVPVYIEENGETEVVERAEVRARVTGFLKEIRFDPGAEVVEGDELYIIEPDQYQATRNSAQAALEAAAAAIQVAQAQVKTLDIEVDRAKKELDRQEMLLAQEATTQQKLDSADAAHKAAQAQVAAAEANVVAANADRNKAQQDVVQADLDLDYTTVRAPISGNITKTEVKLGNLVELGTHLATIVNRKQIYANLNLSDREVLRLQQAAIRKRREEGREERFDLSEVKITLQREIDKGFPFEGHLDYLDQEGVDQATGTFALRGILENPNDQILPGLFVRVRVRIGEQQDAILIPESAVVRDQQGMYVQVLDQKGKLSRRSIVIGQVVETTIPGDGPSGAESEAAAAETVLRMVVVEEGLTSQDRVVIEGGYGIRPGTEVDAAETSLAGIRLIDAEPAGDDEDPAVPADGVTSE